MKTSKITNIAKNTSYFTFALILQKIISFTYFALIARSLGPENLGKYYFAISFASIFAIFIDFGLANVVTREVAKVKDNAQAKAQSLISSVLAIKIPISILIFGIIILIINLLDYPDLTRNLVYLSAICVILDSFSLAFLSIIRGFHNLIFESIGAVIFQLLVLIFGLSFLYSDLGLIWLMGALIIASSFFFIYSALALIIRFKIKLVPKFNFTLIKSIFLITLPFGIFAIFQKIYTFLDSVLLSVLAGDEYVGLYQVAFKIVNALQFLPLAFTASLYPAFSSYWIQNRDQLKISFERSMNYLMIISLPIVAGIISLADKIILIFKQAEFASSIIPLQIIIIAIIFIFLAYPIGSLLNACDRQKINTQIMGIALIASIGLNLILIPYFNTVGASITVVVTNCLILTIGLFQAYKIIEYSKLKLLIIFLKTLASALIMSALAIYAKELINIFVLIPICGVVYFGVLFLVGGYSREDIFSILSTFNKK